MSISISEQIPHVRFGAGTPLVAVLFREFRAARLNRYVQVFSALALCGGTAAVFVSESPGATAAFLLQISLYFVSLFALLAGVSAARAEAEEWPILFSQPAPRWTSIAGKFAALCAIFAGVLVLLFAPALFSDGSPATLALLYGQTLELAAVFGSLGLCAGIFAADRVQGLIAGVSAWLILLFGLDLVALVAAQWEPLQKLPDVWVALLMVNPLDAFRLNALFAFEQIPTEAANKTPLAGWWLTHAGLWLGILSLVWIKCLLALAARRLARTEI